jgi:hypothetical protein
MVWSQYIYEATVDLDSYVSGDEDDGHDITPLNIEDWEVEYSEELGFMWNMINTLLYDARIRHSGEFCDFVEFCYDEHDPYRERETSDYDVQLAHIWKNLRRVINDNGLHEEMMRGATFYHFVVFANNFMCLY